MNSFQTYLFDTQMGPQQVLPFQVKMDLVVMTMKWNSILPSAPEL